MKFYAFLIVMSLSFISATHVMAAGICGEPGWLDEKIGENNKNLDKALKEIKESSFEELGDRVKDLNGLQALSIKINESFQRIDGINIKTADVVAMRSNAKNYHVFESQKREIQNELEFLISDFLQLNFALSVYDGWQFKSFIQREMSSEEANQAANLSIDRLTKSVSKSIQLQTSLLKQEILLIKTTSQREKQLTKDLLFKLQIVEALRSESYLRLQELDRFSVFVDGYRADINWFENMVIDSVLKQFTSISMLVRKAEIAPVSGLELMRSFRQGVEDLKAQGLIKKQGKAFWISAIESLAESTAVFENLEKDGSSAKVVMDYHQFVKQMEENLSYLMEIGPKITSGQVSSHLVRHPDAEVVKHYYQALMYFIYNRSYITVENIEPLRLILSSIEAELGSTKIKPSLKSSLNFRRSDFSLNIKRLREFIPEQQAQKKSTYSSFREVSLAYSKEMERIEKKVLSREKTVELPNSHHYFKKITDLLEIQFLNVIYGVASISKETNTKKLPELERDLDISMSVLRRSLMEFHLAASSSIRSTNAPGAMSMNNIIVGFELIYQYKDVIDRMLASSKEIQLLKHTMARTIEFAKKRGLTNKQIERLDLLTGLEMVRNASDVRRDLDLFPEMVNLAKTGLDKVEQQASSIAKSNAISPYEFLSLVGAYVKLSLRAEKVAETGHTASVSLYQLKNIFRQMLTKLELAKVQFNFIDFVDAFKTHEYFYTKDERLLYLTTITDLVVGQIARGQNLGADGLHYRYKDSLKELLKENEPSFWQRHSPFRSAKDRLLVSEYDAAMKSVEGFIAGFKE